MTFRAWILVALGFVWALIVVILFTTSCATTQTPARAFRPPHFPDLESTRTSIQCAIAQRFGPRMAVTADGYDVVETDPPLPFGAREYIYAWTGPRPVVVLDSTARTALSSPLRHAVFWHIVPAMRGMGWNWDHASKQIDADAWELDRLAGLCRSGQL